MNYEATTILWLIWSNEHCGWWKPNELGYTHVRSEAGRYSFDRAYEIVTRANQYLRGEHVANETMCPDWGDLVQENIQSRIYRGELETTDAEGVQTMKDLQ